MYGRKACQLVKELASSEKGQLTPYNSDVFDQVTEECSQHHLELQSLIRIIFQQIFSSFSCLGLDISVGYLFSHT
ncbi:hypothetical protein CJ030_MR3G026555 [Morella rubra]|uniref:Uncharacterized protein n=1 Tax=Morella rubra TaxID=262757 RepID=A0A6A1W0R1_9ROSI|nr:hypothetical protein CJ030_MR3G026555 [Morella rubra]